MPSIFERLDNREAFPVEIKGGTIYLREPTFGELERIASVKGENLSGALAVALCVVEQDGSLSFPPVEGEDDAALAQRVLPLLKPLRPSDMGKIENGIKQLTKPVDAEELPKNS